MTGKPITKDETMKELVEFVSKYDNTQKKNDGLLSITLELYYFF